MRKRPAAIVAGLLAWLLLCSNALAATLDINVGSKEVYSKGNSVTVEASGSSGDKTVITADDNSAVTYNRVDGGGTLSGSTDVSGYTVYGGWQNGDHSSSDTSVTMEGGSVAAIYGGSKSGDVDDTNVEVTGGTVAGDVYGGSKSGDVDGSTDVDVAGTATVGGSVYGGSNNGDVNGNTDTDIAGTATVNGSVYGGSNNGDVNGNTDVDVSGGTVKGDVYGGGKGTGSSDSDIHGNTDVTVSGGQVNGSVYGGSENGDIEDRSGTGYTEGNTKVTISGGQVGGSVYAGSKSKGKVENDATIEIRGGVVVSKKVYGTGGVEATQIDGDVNIKLYSFSASSYVFFLKKNLSGTSIISLLGDFAQYGGYTVVRDPSKDPTANIWAWVLQPQPARTLTVKTKFVLSGNPTPVNTITTSVSIPAGAPTTVSPSAWDGGLYYTVGAYPASLQIGYNFSYPDNTVCFNVPVTANADTVSVTFNYTYGGSTIFTETKTSAVLNGSNPSSTVSSSWAGNTYFAAASSGPVTVNFGDADKTVNIPLTAKTDTVNVTFNYTYGGSTIYTETKTSAVLSYGSASSSLSSSWAGNTYFAAASSGTVTVNFGDADKTVNIPLTAKTDTVDVTFNYTYGGSTIYTEAKTSAVLSYGSTSDSLSSSWAGNTYFEAASGGPVTVNFGDADKTVSIPLTAITDTVSVTFNYTYGGSTIYTETKTSAVLSYGSTSDSLSSSWAGNMYFEAASSDDVTVNFGDADKTVSTPLTAITDTVSVTFNYTYGGSIIYTETKTSAALLYGSTSDSLSSSWAGNTNFEAASGGPVTVNFGDGDQTVNISLTPKTKTVMVVFNYLYRGSIVHTEQIPASVTYDGALASVTPTWDGDGDYIVPDATPVSVGFDYQGQVMTVEITVRRPNNDNNPQVPLGPGTEGNPDIPLGLPRTGDASYSLLSLLVFAGISLAAKARRRAK